MFTDTLQPCPVTAAGHGQETDKGRLLTALARAAISRALDVATPTPPDPDWLRAPGAVFVTLTQRGQLRGCIGSLEAHRSLGEDVAENARHAAFDDPRFPPLAREELASTRVEVSVLSAATAIAFKDEADALAQLRPGEDGVILEYGWHRATFLPQVWEQLPEPWQFMAHLKRKAGLSADYWSADFKLYRYCVEKYQEAPHDGT